MKRIIRLTESDLARIVKRVIREQKEVSEEEEEGVVSIDYINQEDIQCFSEVATPPGKKAKY